MSTENPQQPTSKAEKNAILDFYLNMESFFDNLDRQGQKLFRAWVENGDISLLFGYLPVPIVQYFRRAVAS